MFIRNGLRVLGGNFILAFKHAVYLIFSAALSIFLFVLSAKPIASLLKSSGWVKHLSDLFESAYVSPSEFAERFRDVATELYEVLFVDLQTRWWNYLLCVVMIVVLPAFLFYIGEYTLGVLINSKTKSMLKSSYFMAFITNIGRSSVYSFVKLLVSLPFLVIVVIIGYGYGVVANNWFNAAALLPILVAVVALVLAFKFTFTIGFLPEAVQGGNPFTAFIRAIDGYLGGYFVKSFYVFAVFIVEVACVVFVGLFSVGAGLVVAIPTVCVLNVALSFADYYQVRKENYYAQEGKIIKPL